MEEEVNFPSGDELETEGDELGFLKNLDLNVEAMEGEEQSAAPMSSKVDSANLQEDLEQGQQPESRTSSKVAKYAYTDVRYRQYQRGLVSNPLLASQSDAHTIAPHRDPTQSHPLIAPERKKDRQSKIKMQV